MSNRWKTVEELFHRALERDPADRPVFLSGACGGDGALRGEVEALLASHEKAGQFLEAAAVDPYVGATVQGRYTIEREIARGGVGVVYYARDTQLLSKPVVVKVLLDSSMQSNWSGWFKNKFHHEVEALTRIDHPGIVGILDAGVMPDGKPFLVMQFVNGVSLRAHIREGGLDLARAADLIRQIGHALQAAHDQGVLHRDLKPENVMVQALGDGEHHVKIIDFGLAKVENSQRPMSTAAGMVLGTIAYMAPEQLRSAPATPSVDVYALGVIAYEIVTGKLPFRAASFVELYEAQKAGVSVPPGDLRADLPAAAQAAILRALSFDANGRPLSVRAFAEAFAGAVSSASDANPPGAGAASDSSGDTLPLVGDSAPTFLGSETAGDLPLEPVGGAVPLDSPFYIVRPADEEFRAAIARREAAGHGRDERQLERHASIRRGQCANLSRKRDGERPPPRARWRRRPARLPFLHRPAGRRGVPLGRRPARQHRAGQGGATDR